MNIEDPELMKELAMKYGGGGTSHLTPYTIAFTLIMILVIIFVEKKYVFVPILLTSVFMTLEQRIVISNLDFMIIRIILIVGLLRIILRKEIGNFDRHRLDNIFLLWIASSVISFTLLHSTMGAFINRMGFAIDTFSIYLLFRCTISNTEDIKRYIIYSIYIAIGVSILMVIEWSTGKNLFYIFGGVHEFSVIRDGRIRCQGAFAHALNAGAYGASLLPLILALKGNSDIKKIFIPAGIVASTVIVATSSSSAPSIGYISGILFLFAFALRNYTRQMIFGSILSIVFLHLIMKAPVWALIGRAKVFGGSTGYHRYKLIDEFITRIDEWWLFGTKYTSHWGKAMWDITNTYIHVGVNGGLLTLILFILILYYSFRSIGDAIKYAVNINEKWFYWAIGCNLVAHSVMFIGMSYFDQIKFILYSHIAIIGSIRSYIIQNKKNGF